MWKFAQLASMYVLATTVVCYFLLLWQLVASRFTGLSCSQLDTLIGQCLRVRGGRGPAQVDQEDAAARLKRWHLSGK